MYLSVSSRSRPYASLPEDFDNTRQSSFPFLRQHRMGGGRQWAALPPDPVYVSSPQAMRLLHPASWGRIVSSNILNMFTIKPSTLSSIYSVMSHPRPPMAALLVAIYWICSLLNPLSCQVYSVMSHQRPSVAALLVALLRSMVWHTVRRVKRQSTKPWTIHSL